jgi:hypothetical protein
MKQWILIIVVTGVLAAVGSYYGEKLIGDVSEPNREAYSKVKPEPEPTPYVLKDKDSKTVTYYLLARDVKTCMKALGVSVIDNKVIKCNQGGVYQIDADKVEQFEKENGL